MLAYMVLRKLSYVKMVCGLFRSWSGYNDELCWGAAWLYKATGESQYKSKAETAMDQMGSSEEYSWDSKHIGCYVSNHLFL